MMNLDDALATIRSMAAGENPDTGMPFGPNSVLDNPRVIRALHFILSELEQKQRTQGVKPEVQKHSGSFPEQAGKTWSAQDDQTLINQWKSGVPIQKIASQFQRSRGSIAARLVRLGLIQDRRVAK